MENRTSRKTAPNSGVHGVLTRFVSRSVRMNMQSKRVLVSVLILGAAFGLLPLATSPQSASADLISILKSTFASQNANNSGSSTPAAPTHTFSCSDNAISVIPGQCVPCPPLTEKVFLAGNEACRKIEGAVLPGWEKKPDGTTCRSDGQSYAGAHNPRYKSTAPGLGECCNGGNIDPNPVKAGSSVHLFICGARGSGAAGGSGGGITPGNTATDLPGWEKKPDGTTCRSDGQSYAGAFNPRYKSTAPGLGECCNGGNIDPSPLVPGSSVHLFICGAGGSGGSGGGITPGNTATDLPGWEKKPDGTTCRSDGQSYAGAHNPRYKSTAPGLGECCNGGYIDPNPVKAGSSVHLFICGSPTAGRATVGNPGSTGLPATSVGSGQGGGDLSGATGSATTVGSLDSASSSQFKGWAFDRNATTAVVDVVFYADATIEKGGIPLTGSVRTLALRDDVNTTYGIGGTHGFNAGVVLATSVNVSSLVAGSVTIPLSLQDGRDHFVFAYAVDASGVKNMLGGSPKSVSFGRANCVPTSTGSCAGAAGAVGSGGGGSGRHNYLTPCDGAGIAGKDDPAIVVEVKADGTIVGSIDIKNVPDAVVKINGTITTSKNFTLKAGDSISVTTKNGTYSADADGLAKGENASVLVPMPCIRIGYDDVLGGQQCGDGQDGTCADELDAFINVESIQNAGIKDTDYEIWYKVKGGKYDTGGWKKYDWKNCGQYSNHCIRLAGAGVIYAKTKIITGTLPGSWSLTAQKEFDVAKGKF